LGLRPLGSFHEVLTIDRCHLRLGPTHLRSPFVDPLPGVAAWLYGSGADRKNDGVARRTPSYAVLVTSVIILVTAEYMVDDSPLWYRGSRGSEHFSVAEAADLGLSASLRHDLQAWNDVFEHAWDAVFDDRDESRPVASPSVSPEVLAAHGVEAFTLASRVQLELGDDTHVWCGAGGGIDAVTESGTAVVLPSRRPGTEVEFLHDGKRDVRSARAAGAREGTAKAVVHWRSLTERVGTPFGDAATRALGLRTAGRLQSDVGPPTQVVFYAGASAQYRFDEFD
jgi:hypothetical protein